MILIPMPQEVSTALEEPKIPEVIGKWKMVVINSVPIIPRCFCCFSRFLLGDQAGRLFIVMLAAIEDNVELHLDVIGEVC